jgi:hypothetical protein
MASTTVCIATDVDTISMPPIALFSGSVVSEARLTYLDQFLT